MAIERPLLRNIRTSFGMSPMVAICSGEMFRSFSQRQYHRALVGLRVGDIEIIGLRARRTGPLSQFLLRQLLAGGDAIEIVGDPDDLHRFRQMRRR